MNEADNTESQDPREQAERIVVEDGDIRQRVRDLVVTMVKKGSTGLDQLAGVTREVIDGALAGINRSVPDDPDNVLRRVVDGLADGFAVTATAAKLAFEEARGRGQAFNDDEVKKTVDDLKAIEQRLLETLKQALSETGTQLGDGSVDLAAHAARAMDAARPSIAAAVRAATRKPGSFAVETGKAGAQVVGKAAGTFMQAMTGLVEGAGDVMRRGQKADGPRDEEEVTE